MKLAICCIAKNENLTICDWVKHHLDLGIDKVVIFDNNEDDSLLDTLNAHNGEIDLSKVLVLTDFKGAKDFQMKAYNLFHQNNEEYDWVGYLDCDEYLAVDKSKIPDIKEWFKEAEEKCPDIQALFINWRCYGDNGNYFYEDAPVMERFPNPIPSPVKRKGGYVNDENAHIKSFVRKGVKGQFDWNPHNFIPTEGEAYLVNFTKAKKESPWQNYSEDFPIRVNHYVTKSLEEYIIRKFNSTCADNAKRTPYDLSYYFSYNPVTPEMLSSLHSLQVKYGIRL